MELFILSVECFVQNKIMADHAEEQEMEAEAMAAIFDSHFEVLGAGQWNVTIYPESGADLSELNAVNHVGCKLLVTLPPTYPDLALPELDIEIVKGLAEEQRQDLKALAEEEAAANSGAPSLFAVTERLREWLLENNVKGLDDVSMHAQMMRKKQQEEKAQVRSFPTAEYAFVHWVEKSSGIGWLYRPTCYLRYVYRRTYQKCTFSETCYGEIAICFPVSCQVSPSLVSSARLYSVCVWSRSHSLYHLMLAPPSRQCFITGELCERYNNHATFGSKLDKYKEVVVLVLRQRFKCISIVLFLGVWDMVISGAHTQPPLMYTTRFHFNTHSREHACSTRHNRHLKHKRRPT